MTIALLAYENFPLPVIQGLRDADYDILSIAQVSAGLNDRTVLSMARETGRCLLTFDVNFGDLVFFSWYRASSRNFVFPFTSDHHGRTVGADIVISERNSIWTFYCNQSGRNSVAKTVDNLCDKFQIIYTILEGGHTKRALGVSIFTEADDLDELHQ